MSTTNSDGTIDVAAYINEGKEIPRGRHYAIQIDRKTYVVKSEMITGRELLLLAGKTPPERFQLNQFFRFGRVEKVELDETVDLATCGIERFATIPLDQTEGRPGRSDFFMPEADGEFLEANHFQWETIREGSTNWLIIRSLPIPPGYNVEKADLALQIPPSFPAVEIDMGYFYPALNLKNGRKIRALASRSIEGKNYQRWSRHRTPANPWRPGIDDVSTHLSQVTHWLERELNHH